MKIINDPIYSGTSLMRSFAGSLSFRLLALCFLAVFSASAQITLIPQIDWALHYVDSQDTDVDDNAGSKAFDGNPNTFWNSQWFAAKPNLPHEIQINLGGVYNITGFRHLPRQDGRPNGRIGQYEFYISSDGVNWGAPAITGTLANIATEQQVNFTARSGQYVRLRALTDHSGTTYRTSLAELNLLQDGPPINQGPNSVINTPASDATIPAGSTVSFTGTGTDPDNHLPLSYLWSFGAGSGIPNSTAEDPGAAQFNTPGVFRVTLTTTDSVGLTESTPATRTITVQASPATLVPKTNWTLLYVDSQEAAAGNWSATNAFDGNPSTLWHTQYSTSQPSHPHEIQINLGAVYNITGFRHLPRQDGNVKGRIGQYEFYVSSNGTDWGAAVASGTFANVATEQQVTFPGKSGQYIRLRALSETGGTFRTSLAELSVLQNGGPTNQAPNGTIDTPTTNTVITAGGTVDFTGSGSDPDGNVPLTYQWTFGAGSGVADSTVQDPGNVQFNSPGSFTVTFHVTDSLGLADPTPATRTITVEAPSGSLIPKTNWALRYVDSQETAAGNWSATNAFDGNPSTLWHTQYSASQPPHPHEIQINLGGVYNITGFRHLPRQDGGTKGRISQYEFYVSSNGTDWGTAVASGTLANVATEQQVTFPGKVGQYVRLRALSETGGTFRTSLAELSVLQTGDPINLGPNGTIDTPSANTVIATGGTVNFSGNGSDPDNHVPLTYRWTFGAGSGVGDSTVEDPGNVQFNSPGTFTVTLTVTDSQGLADSVPATRTITVQSPAPIVLSQAAWTLQYFDSQETSSDFSGGRNGIAANAFDGDPRSFWHTRSVTAQPPPPHEIQINLGAVHEIGGFRYLPRQDNNQKGRIGLYEFYVSMDGVSWGSPVATGMFANIGAESEVLFAPKTGRYARLRALTEVNGHAFSSVAELNLLTVSSGSNQAPDGTIGSPAGDVTISAGGVIPFTATGNDPDNNIPLRYRWSFGAGSGIADIYSEDPGLVEFNVPGIHTVRLTVADAWGLADSTPTTRTVTVQGGTPISTTAWSLHYVDSQDTEGGNYAATNAFDGNPATFWHTEWFNTQTPPPHEIQIDLGAFHDVGGFRYLPRQDGATKGRIGSFEFYVSLDGTTWNTPIATGVIPNSGTQREVQFMPATARYIRLKALSEVTSLPYTSAAELGILEAAYNPPSVRLLQPRSFSLQTSNQIRVRADGFIPSGYGVRMMVDGGSGAGGAQQDDYTWPYETSFTGLSAAEHVVDAFIINETGAVMNGIGMHDQAKNVGIGDYYVALGDSITFGIADDVPTDNAANDGRNNGGGWTPLLAELLTAETGHPVHVANEGKPGELSGGGATRIHAILQKHPQAQRILIMYGTNDASEYLGGPVPSGLGLSPGDPGYAGSYKANMQSIIDAVNSAGRIPILAKVPYVAFAPTADARVQQYNQVINELVANPANNIPVTPPDFHSYFATHYSAQYYPNDSVHPNGVGFQSMAELWLMALEPEL